MKREAEGGQGEFVRTLRMDEPVVDSGPWRVTARLPEVRAGREQSVVTLVMGESITLGADVGCQLVIDDPTVSGRHASLTAGRSGLIVEDLGSKNGLYLAGARVQQAVIAAYPAQFVMGRSTVVVELASRPPAPAPELLLPGLVGDSAPMRRLAADVRRVAPLGAPVLVLGESGTGKDVVARAIHALSRRRGRYVPLNAGALGEALADSELFGHCRGAFTGAVQARSGAFELADRGTLFLDEVADLAPSIQVKLLRAVEDGEVRQVGASAPLQVNTRLVAATWAPLEQRVRDGAFRADLFHRISTFVIRVPPLRQRRSDIPALVTALLASRREQLGERHLSAEALAQLEAYSFPGNVRELFSIVYRAAALCERREVSAADIQAALPLNGPAEEKAARVDARRLLVVHGGNVSAAARSARVARSTFRAWLRRQGAEAPGNPRTAD